MSKLVLDLKVPTQYERAAVTEIVRAICNQVNSLSEGRISARYQASSVVPTGSAVSYAKGDIVWDSNPTVVGSVSPGVAASYVRMGWISCASGSPGTFQELRVLTGS